MYTYLIGPHNGVLLYTRLEGVDDGTEDTKGKAVVGGNIKDEVLNVEAEFNECPVLRFKLLATQN